MKYVQGAFAVAEPGDAGGIDGALTRKDTDSRDEFIEMRTHAQLAEQGARVLSRVLTGDSLVIAQRRDAGIGKRGLSTAKCVDREIDRMERGLE